MSSDLIACVLNGLASSYLQPVSATAVAKASKSAATKVSKLAQVKAAKAEQDGSQAAPVVAAVPLTTIALPEAGALDARSFLVAMRRAADRDQCIQAIAAFCGYDRTLPFGGQETMARMKAQRDLRPAKAGPKYNRNATQSMGGMVAGCPNILAKRVSDLEGRAVLAGEAVADYERQATEHANRGDQANADMCHTLANVERERLVQIRADLTAFRNG